MIHVTDPPRCILSAVALREVATAARRQAIVDWEFPDWSLQDLNSPRMVWQEEVQQLVGQELKAKGFAIIRLTDLVETLSPGNAAAAVTMLAGALGQPLRVFLRHPHWRKLGVDLSRPSDSSGAAGHQSFHMDFVNAENPPDLVCLWCVRPDPMGGGASLVAPIVGIEDLLDAHHVEALSRPHFSDGRVEDLNGIGHDINPFAVLATKSHWRYRYTAKLLQSAPNEDAREAVDSVARILEVRGMSLVLDRGDLLILNQHLVTHGRGAMGEGQQSIPVEERRLLLQSFVRDVILEKYDGSGVE